MNLRAKTLLIVAVTSAGLLAGLLVSARIIVLDGFAGVEESSVRDNVQRVEGALESETARIDGTAGDWALWDDTYYFVQDQNQDYIDANLSAAALANLNVNFMVFVDDSGEVVTSIAVDLETGEEAMLDKEALTAITSSDTLYRHTGADSSVSGVLSLPDMTALVSSRPIMTSAYEGPIMGALVVGRYINESFVTAIEKTTNTSLSFADLSANPAAAEAAGLASAPAGTIAVEPVDSSSINGESVITDVSGAPALLLQTSMPRDIYSQGTATIRYLIGALLFAGIVFAVIAVILLERTVLARLSSLSAAVGRIGASNDSSLRVPASGGDELARLGADINGMLGSIEGFNQSLEEKIRERTKDLEAANSELRDRNRQLLEARTQAATDGLTNLGNHRTFQDEVRKLVPNREESSVSVIMLDIDHFKKVNDALGHPAGDQILRACGDVLASVAGAQNVYRYGGDEFALVLDNTDFEQATAVAEELRKAVETRSPYLRGITISLGVAEYPSASSSAEELIYRADAAMYSAKAAGKNRTCRWDRMDTAAKPARRSAPVR